MKEKCLNELAMGMFLDNELSQQEQQEVVDHLETCGRCREQLQQQETENACLQETFAVKSQSAGSPDLAPLVMEKLANSEIPIEQQPPKVINLLKYRWTLPAAASILLAAFLVVFFLVTAPQKTENNGHRVILCSAKVDGQEVQSHIFQSEEPDIQFIWLEKEK